MKKESIEKILEQGTPRQKIFLLFADIVNKEEEVDTRYLTEEEKDNILELVRNNKKLKSFYNQVEYNYNGFLYFRKHSSLALETIQKQVLKFGKEIETKILLDNCIKGYQSIAEIISKTVGMDGININMSKEVFQNIIINQFASTEIGNKLEKLTEKQSAIDAMILLSKKIDLLKEIKELNEEIENAKTVIETLKNYILKLLPIPAYSKKIRQEEQEICMAIKTAQHFLNSYLYNKKLPPKYMEKYRILDWLNIKIDSIEDNIKAMQGIKDEE